MKKLALVWLVVFALLGGAWWFLRAPAGPGAAASAPAWVRTLDPSLITALSITQADGSQAAVRRDASGVWVLDEAGRPSWPVAGETVRAAVRLLLEAGARPAVGLGSDEIGPVTTVVLTAGSRTHGFEVATSALGGLARVRVAGDEEGSVAVLGADAGLASLFLTPGLRAWRSSLAMGSEITDPSRLHLDVKGSLIEAARTQAKWTMTKPFSVWADAGAIQRLVGGLCGVKITRFDAGGAAGGAGIGPEQAVLSMETDLRTAVGTEVRRRVLFQELRVGSEVEGGGATHLALAVAQWIDPETGVKSPAWGPEVVAVTMSGVALPVKADPLLSRQSLWTSPMDVRALRLCDVDNTEGVADERVRLTRTLDGWQAVSRGTTSMLSQEKEAGLRAMLTMLCETTASTASLTAPEGVRWAGSLRIMAGDREAERVDIGRAKLTVASGTQDVVVTRGSNGRVYRVYAAGLHAGAMAWFAEMIPGEG